MPPLPLIAASLGITMLVVALAHCMCVLGAALQWHLAGRSGSHRANARPPVSVFKPLCGTEIGLYNNLKSFCTQDYPEYEIIFGVQSPDDPALEVVRRLVQEHPGLRIISVIDSRCHGSNRKVSNLRNMTEQAHHDLWVIADSDAAVSPEYLSVVTAPLQEPGVGLVTCPYHGLPGKNYWSRLAAMYVNDWFMPSVLLAWALGYRDYVSGQTICVRRETMTAIGGLAALSDHLADDYQLGALIRRSGRRIVMSHYAPQAQHHEPTLSSLLQHEIRWMRTIAVLKPGSFRLLFLSFALPMAMLGLALAAAWPAARGCGLWLAAVVAALRLVIHASAQRATLRGVLRDAWLIPVRDLLIAYVWARALRASKVTWRGVEFHVENDGILKSVAERVV